MDVAIETDRESILVNIVNEVSSGNVVMRRRGQVFIDQEL